MFFGYSDMEDQEGSDHFLSDGGLEAHLIANPGQNTQSAQFA